MPRADFYLRDDPRITGIASRLDAPAKYYLLLVNNNNKKTETREKEEERSLQETAVWQKVPAMYRALGRPHFIARLHRRRCARAMPKRQCTGTGDSYFLCEKEKERKRETLLDRRKCENNTDIVKEIGEQEKSLDFK